MSVGLPNDFKELVRSNTDLVALVAESVSLTPLRGGTDYLGLCPFHDDHNPSFHVYPDRQSYRCWVCDEGGDCFSWVMKRESVEFPEAVELLARRANLEIPRRSGQSPAEPRRVTTLETLAWAEQLFHECLLHSSEAVAARSYLQERGINDEAIARFRIGFHPQDWQWILRRASGLYSTQQLLAARLVRERSDGRGERDDFVGRVLFPIHDLQGRCVAFGGRVLPGAGDESGPKYLNSPESDVFSKNQLLYGIHAARDEIRRQGTAIVVEGYTDCILAWVHGVSNVVGTLGTALTVNHVRNLKRFARQIVLVYDGDAAGQSAAERAIGRFLAQDVDVRILTLPENSDPAEFLAAYGHDAFRKMVGQAKEAWAFKFDSIVSRIGTKTIDARHQVLDEMLQLLSQSSGLSGSVREDLIIPALAQRLSLREDTIRTELAGKRRQTQRKGAAEQDRLQRSPSPPPQTSQVSAALRNQEQEVLETLVASPELVAVARTQIGDGHFQCFDFQRLWHFIVDLHEDEGEVAIPRLMRCLDEEPDLKSLLIRLEDSAVSKDLRQKIQRHPELLTHALTKLTSREEAESQRQIKGQLAEAEPTEDPLGEHIRALLQRASTYHKSRVTREQPANH